MLRRIVLGAVTRLLQDEVLQGAAASIMQWLNPCRRLTWAKVMYRRRWERRQYGRAAFWHWRIEVLADRCRKLREGGLCAADIAERAAAEAITEAIAKEAWPQ